ncbi:MAG TPA: AsmA-like C-terminal region-containing protein [Blastocatellia bacterium]|nr:AsmA-like C-terminal region-containing protein [Blastocatellia bacterium]
MNTSFVSKLFKRALIVVVVIASVIFALLVTVFSPERFRASVEQRLTVAFGRPAHVASMRYTILRGIGVEASGVVIEEDPSFGAGPFLKVDSVWADLGIWNAIRGSGSIVESLEFERPSVTLVKRDDGVWNWTTLGKASNAPPETAEVGDRAPELALAGTTSVVASRVTTPDRIVLDGASVSTIDQTAEPGAIYTYKEMHLDTTVVPSDAGYHVAGSVSGDSQPAGGEPLDIDAQFDVMLKPPRELPSWQAEGSIPSGHFATRNLRLDSMSTRLALVDGKTVHFDQLTATMYGGTIAGSVVVDVTTAGNRFTADARLAGVSLADALAYRDDLAGSIEGRLSASFRGSGTLGHLNTTLASLDGSGHIDVQNARLVSVGVLQNLAEHGGFHAGAFGGAGTSAREVSSNFTVRAGRAELDGATISGLGDCANMTASHGWIDLHAPSALSMDGTLTLLPQFFTDLATANPDSATLLGAIGALPAISIPVALNGPVRNPSVRVQWPSVRGPF